MKHCAKKQKIDEVEASSDTEPSCLVCVLPEEITSESIPLVDIYVGTVIEKKFIRDTIVDLNKVVPVSELQHLKRVKKDKVIICFTSVGTEQEVFSKLLKLGFNYKLINDKLEVFSVSKFPPKTRRQFLFSNEIWPTNFHEDKHLENLLSGRIFSENEVRGHEKWMRMAVEAAHRSPGTRGGTVVVDENRLVAVASDSRDSHPLKHSVMVAVDLVARWQGGGAWDPHLADYFSKEPFPGDTGESPYLCTGYYVYTVREPCTMCAMALVHSRVKRVFYGIPSANGALGTLLKLHTIKNLNHHFEVFKGLLQSEINSLS